MSENSRFSFHSLAPEETATAGERLAQALRPTAFAEGALAISLIGELGAGKTHFVKGLAAGLGLDPMTVTSPTFAIVNEYERATGPQLVHLDFYRLESEMALEEVGFLDLMALPAVLAIEWGNRFPRSLPRDHVQVEIQRGTVAPGEVDSSTGSAGGTNNEQQIEETSPRIFNVMATGERSLEVASVWREALGAVARTFTIS